MAVQEFGSGASEQTQAQRLLEGARFASGCRGSGEQSKSIQRRNPRRHHSFSRRRKLSLQRTCAPSAVSTRLATQYILLRRCSNWCMMFRHRLVVKSRPTEGRRKGRRLTGFGLRHPKRRARASTHIPSKNRASRRVNMLGGGHECRYAALCFVSCALPNQGSDRSEAPLKSSCAAFEPTLRSRCTTPNRPAATPDILEGDEGPTVQ
ncbi:hypothetical protein B0H16DRAFT_935662 [Mycena metata]|uniref:Uncharacterized protein n=1 Tax=Mycena metata TaxID=1033252 RepID=A0AAD7N5T0_9AGAR|nr:hypothetical protein B0H16DRAFT_935662 [Mycena metata]